MKPPKKYISMILFCFMIFIGCRADDFSKKKIKDIIPDVIGQESLDSLEVEENNAPMPETTFENVTYLEIEKYYREQMTRGAVYFVGYDLQTEKKSTKPGENDSVILEPQKYTIFVTGNIHDQLTTIALKTGGRLYQLNDDYYIVKSDGSDAINYNVSSVFVSTLEKEQIQALLTMYQLQGESVGLQTVVRGSLLDIVDFKRSFDKLQQNKSVYLIDLAFIDFTISEASSFQAFLTVNALDVFQVRNFADLFSMYLDVSVDNLRSRNFYSHSLLASDGNPSTFNVGSSHSREQRAISDQGTSTVNGYNDVKDGFQLTFTPSTCLDSRVFCTVKLENSAFEDDDFLTKSETAIDVQAVPFELGKTYYLSSLTNFVRRRQVDLFGLAFTNNQRVQTCWARVRKIK